ncbi:MAG: hypothetical protein KatS3mg108_3331 [Isosphaeraceae bacterium]|jgi:hypothetical protein|nr:MAG: hypothetical protein KatS3mg108_3331 [Isosphaeraceae bacterium]
MFIRLPLVRVAVAMILTLAPLLLVVGCGYSIRPPYNPAIRTVYLPVFQSFRFRRDLNIQLTELLRAEIVTRTPYRVVANPEGADARLEGTVIFDDKNVMVENPNNLPRHILGTLTVNVTFTDNRSGSSRSKSIPAAVVTESAPFYPEIGEPAQAGFEKAMKEIVRDIVNMMEEPWGEEYLSDEPDSIAAAADPADSTSSRIRR